MIAFKAFSGVKHVLWDIVVHGEQSIGGLVFVCVNVKRVTKMVRVSTVHTGDTFLYQSIE